MWIITQDGNLANLANAFAIRSARQGDGWVLEAVYAGGETVALATYATESEAEDLRRHIRYYIKAQSVVPVELDFAPAVHE